MTKIIRFLAIFSIFGITSSSYATMETQIIAQLDDIIATSRHNQLGWPNIDLSIHPIIASFNNEHQYAYYFQPHNPEWIKRSDTPLSYFLDHDAYQIIPIGWSFGINIDNQPSFIFNLDKIGENITTDDLLHILFHERFHIYQIEHFPRDLFSWEIYDGFNNVEVMKLTMLEDVALRDYLKTKNIEAIKNYSAIVSYRKTLMNKDSYLYEIAKEDIEGTADYYSWKVSIKDSHKRNDTIASAYEKKCQPDRFIECHLQDRYYFTGNVSGIALDEFIPSWKSDLELHLKSIREQLLSLFQMQWDEIITRVSQAKLIYDYERISKPIEDIMLQYQSQRDRAMKDWQAQDGIILTKGKTSCPLGGIFSSIKSYHLDSDTRLLIGINGVRQCPDNSVTITYFDTPFSLETESNGNIQIKIPDTSKIKIDNRYFTAKELLASKQTHLFKEFYLKTTAIEIRINNLSGELTTTNQSIELKA